MLNVTSKYSKHHQYELHPQKSTVTHIVCPKSSSSCARELYLGTEPMPKVASFTHLGLDWSEGKSSPDIQKRINAARGTAYQLLGVGLHGHTGMDAATAFKTIETYVTPKLLQGLESSVLKKKDLHQLEAYYRRLLRQVQSLPECTAREAIYILLGTIPLEGLWHIRVLTMFGSISRLGQKHPLHLLAVRQVALRSDNPHSWFAQAIEIAQKYNINLVSSLQSPWPKLAWKKYMKTVVRDWWHQELSAGAAQKSTLQYLELNHLEKPHPLWTCCGGKRYQAEASTTRARMLTGRYGLHAERSRFKQRQVSPTCPLCGEQDEDIIHLIAICPVLESTRMPLLQDLKTIYIQSHIRPPSTPLEVTKAVLNGGGYKIEVGSRHATSQIFNIPLRLNNQPGNLHKKANQLANLICQKLHVARDNHMCHLLTMPMSDTPTGGSPTLKEGSK